MIFSEFLGKFSTEKDMVDFYLKTRYSNKLTCNHCQSEKVYQRRNNLKLFDCNTCGNTFSPFKETIFKKSSTDLRKWMYAIYVLLNGKKNISALQLQREVGVTYKTAWRMLRQIRTAMGNKKQEDIFKTVMKLDETCVGSQPGNQTKKITIEPIKEAKPVESHQLSV